MTGCVCRLQSTEDKLANSIHRKRQRLLKPKPTDDFEIHLFIGQKTASRYDHECSNVVVCFLVTVRTVRFCTFTNPNQHWVGRTTFHCQILESLIKNLTSMASSSKMALAVAFAAVVTPSMAFSPAGSALPLRASRSVNAFSVKVRLEVATEDDPPSPPEVVRSLLSSMHTKERHFCAVRTQFLVLCVDMTPVNSGTSPCAEVGPCHPLALMRRV